MAHKSYNINRNIKKALGILTLTLAVSGHSVADDVDTMPNLKVLAESSTGWVRNFNPWVGGRSNFSYESLVHFNLLDSSKEHFLLATGYELSDDLKVLTVSLRENVKWSDGVDFTADDVVFSFEYPTQHPEIDLNGIAKKVEKIVKIDDHKVEIYLTEANAFAARDVIDASTLIVPKHVWENESNPSAVVNPNPVASGPFTEVARFSPQVYVLCRNPYYYNDEKLSVNCLEFPQYSSDNAALELLSKGQVDWGGVFIPDIDRTYASKAPGNKYWFPSAGIVKLAFNFETKNPGANEAFNDIEFRKAVSLVMDRDAIFHLAGYGYGDPGNAPASALPGGLWEWRDKQADQVWQDYSHFDVKEAKNILDQAGYKDVSGNGYVETPNGTELSFRIQVPSGWGPWVNSADIAIEGLRAIGINATVVTPEYQSYIQNISSNDFEALIGNGIFTTSIWKFYNTQMHSQYQSTPGWTTSLTNYINPQLDQWIEELSLTTEPSQQAELVGLIERHWADNVLQFPLYRGTVSYTYNDSRFEGFASAENPFVSPAPYGMSNLIHVLEIKPKQTN